jgi:transposase
MKILALDLSRFKSVGCVYEAESGEHRYRRVNTRPAELHDLLVELGPDRVVIEVSSISGWVSDLVRALGIELQVANTNGEAWRWRNVKQKHDQGDGLKLARLSAMNQLELVHVPAPQIRQWRAVIKYRQHLVGRRTDIKNHVRELLVREGVLLPRGRKCWSQLGCERLEEEARSWEQVEISDLWRGELQSELQQLREVQERIREVEAKLETLAAADERVSLLQTIPGVGPRLAEAMVALIDDPHRFKRGRDVGAYFGLVPRQYQSGEMNRLCRITKRGSKMLRSLLVEVSWVSVRYNSWLRSLYEKVHRGSKTRKKIAIVAVARRLAIYCWAMLRDGTSWRPPLGQSFK